MANMAWKTKMTAQMEKALELGVTSVWYLSLSVPLSGVSSQPAFPTP